VFAGKIGRRISSSLLGPISATVVWVITFGLGAAGLGLTWGGGTTLAGLSATFDRVTVCSDLSPSSAGAAGRFGRRMKNPTTAMTATAAPAARRREKAFLVLSPETSEKIRDEERTSASRAFVPGRVEAAHSSRLGSLGAGGGTGVRGFSAGFSIFFLSGEKNNEGSDPGSPRVNLADGPGKTTAAGGSDGAFHGLSAAGFSAAAAGGADGAFHVLSAAGISATAGGGADGAFHVLSAAGISATAGGGWGGVGFGLTMTGGGTGRGFSAGGG
jgi:hypothetical protein